jgi:hypothetical protein
MALTELLFKKTATQVGLIRFDATPRETHTKTNEVTSHPVESGASISDHIRRMPQELEINGIVTNHPVTILASVFATSPKEDDLTNPFDRVGTANEELDRIMDDGELVTVVTSLREYQNMTIVSKSVQREPRSGNILDTTLSLKEVLITTTEFGEIPATTRTQDPPPNGGEASTPPATPPVAEKAVESKTLGEQIIGGAGVLFGGGG